MCRFVPGQAIAIGPLTQLWSLQNNNLPWPGSIKVEPLITEGGDLHIESPLAKIGIAVLTIDPGLELVALSLLSAALSDSIRIGEAVADLNHYLPLGSIEHYPSEGLRFSRPAEELSQALRGFLRQNLATREKRKVVVLDSGLHPAYVPHRNVSYFDYSLDGRLSLDRPRIDPIGHGTRVTKILDEILPPEVDLIVGRLTPDPDAITVLSLAHTFGDIVARTEPDVVNLSVVPRDNVFRCPACRQRVAIPSFLPAFLPLIIRLAGKSKNETVTIMAAGNTGQIPNSRWLHHDIDTLLFAVAQNRYGDRAGYSGAPEGPAADLFSAAAFGGDDPSDPEPVGVFTDGSCGTSYAAPFLAAAALLGKEKPSNLVNGRPTQLAPYVQAIMSASVREQTRLRHLPPFEGGGNH